MYCSRCGKQLAENARYCSGCGFDNMAYSGQGAGYNANPGVNNSDKASSFKTKSAALALILSFLIPGIGQLYIGRIESGIIILIIWVVSVAAWPFTIFLSLLIALVVWVFSMVDAYSRANEYNNILFSTGKPPW